jgi:hypothetical protein
MRLRQEGWELLVQGLRERSDQKMRQAAAKQQQADAIVQQINKEEGE